MTAQFPVHPDDVDQLVRIRRYLIGFRITNGWTQPELSMKINGTKGMVWNLESDQTWQWRISRLQGWVDAFGLRLDARLRFARRGLERRVADDPEVAPFLNLAATSRQWPMWQRMALTSALAVARREQGITYRTLSHRLGISGSAVRNWEAVANNSMLPKILHHARVLGGWWQLGLKDQ